MASPEYVEMKSAEASDDWQRANAADQAYFSELAKVRVAWSAIPDGDAKDVAGENADTMCGVESVFEVSDELAWFRAAISTYELEV